MEKNTLPKRNLPRDLFLHLLAIVSLYWASISFVTLLWQIINYIVPDALNNYSYYYEGLLGLIRFSVSSLIIVFPVFILVSWYLNKIYAREYAVRESKIRKWLIYLTLFVAALVIIGDLVSVVNMLMGGEVTTRFVLKALSILVVAAAVFGYYLDDVRREAPTRLVKPFAWASGVLVLVAIIGAFFIVGSPATARLLQFDQQKISDLQGIQSQIVYYWQRKEILPPTLSDLNDELSYYTVPNDPQGQAYEYNIKDVQNLSFEICATFNKDSDSQRGQVKPSSVYTKTGISENWQHAAGRYCFERTIDRQLYPPLNKQK